MAQRPVIKAEARTEFGKGVARRLRRDWKVTGVIYGAHQEPVHFAVPLLDIQSLVRNNGVNAVLELEIDGEQYLTMVKHVDQNVLTFDIDHVDLLAIKRGEKVEVEVPVTLTGEPAAGTMHIQDADVLLVEADVLNIPEEIEVSIEGLEDGAGVLGLGQHEPAALGHAADPADQGVREPAADVAVLGDVGPQLPLEAAPLDELEAHLAAADEHDVEVQLGVERLFRDRWCILTPRGDTDPAAVERVAALDGTMDVETTPGWGTTLRIEIPLDPPSAALTVEGAEELTDREKQVLRLVATGISNQRIGDQLGITANTVKYHVANLLRKYGARTRAELASITHSDDAHHPSSRTR